MLARIVSGGQTGVDRAALDFAIATGIEYGGWCPLGGWAEDHPKPPGVLVAYPRLAETPGRDPEQRTSWNVRDADATLIVTGRHVGSPGTERALSVARELGRPHAIVETADPAAVSAVERFLAPFDGDVILNVAGPRETEAPGIYTEAGELLRRWHTAQAWRISGGICAT
ncbi:MAG: hypothetical protein QOI10_866 [Solirubrobacterales bacterium]|jgi:hypothetical protein|nr:hypothetical protein [Solirubrobacterales bacterium]